MIITLNGVAADVPEDTSLDGLLIRYEHDGNGDGNGDGNAGPETQRRGVAIARNGEVVPRGLWTRQMLSAGDVIELLIATQGG